MYACKNCGQEFEKIWQLSTHSRKEHPGEAKKTRTFNPMDFFKMSPEEIQYNIEQMEPLIEAKQKEIDQYRLLIEFFTNMKDDTPRTFGLTDLIRNAVDKNNGLASDEIWNIVKTKYKTQSANPKNVFNCTLSYLMRNGEIDRHPDGKYYPTARTVQDSFRELA